MSLEFIVCRLFMVFLFWYLVQRKACFMFWSWHTYCFIDQRSINELVSMFVIRWKTSFSSIISLFYVICSDFMSGASKRSSTCFIRKPLYNFTCSCFLVKWNVCVMGLFDVTICYFSFMRNGLVMPFVPRYNKYFKRVFIDVYILINHFEIIILIFKIKQCLSMCLHVPVHPPGRVFSSPVMSVCGGSGIV